ncbi:MAG TPA: hypothetical protein VFA90_05015 [Terriglobales bacterium]|nr:hypothetical protein [Terriglobales bacterium]
MFSSLKYRFNVVVVLLAALVFSLGKMAFAEECGSLDRARNAIGLAELLYPNLKTEEFGLQFSEGTGGRPSSPTDVRSLLIRVDKPQWLNAQADARPTSEADTSQLGDFQLPMFLHFDFVDYSSTPRRLLCRPGQFRNEKAGEKMSKARELINSHPEWTDEQDLEAATKLGMLFGPDKKTLVLQKIPLKELSKIYGPLRIKTISFRIGGDKCEGCSFADLHWKIEAEKAGTAGSLFISLEPFTGKIDSITG